MQLSSAVASGFVGNSHEWIAYFFEKEVTDGRLTSAFFLLSLGRRTLTRRILFHVTVMNAFQSSCCVGWCNSCIRKSATQLQLANCKVDLTLTLHTSLTLLWEVGPRSFFCLTSSLLITCTVRLSLDSFPLLLARECSTYAILYTYYRNECLPMITTFMAPIHRLHEDACLSCS